MSNGNRRPRVRSTFEIRREADCKAIKTYKCIPRSKIKLEPGQFFFLEETYVALFKNDKEETCNLPGNLSIFICPHDIRTITYSITGYSIEEIKKKRSAQRKIIESPKNRYLIITV